jgi:biopolymer transport protein ExbB
MNETQLDNTAPASASLSEAANAMVTENSMVNAESTTAMLTAVSSGQTESLSEQSSSTLMDLLAMLDAGGPVVMVLLVMSVIALAVVLVKLVQFQRAGMWRRNTAQQVLVLWHQGKADEALKVADTCTSPTAQALARAIRGQSRALPEMTVREEVLRYGSHALFQLRRGLRPLEVIGSLAPLLGLLGTVMGMISAFQQLEAAGNKVNPAILSGGIWEALLTTAVGLCVAIPVVALLNWLERKVDHLAHEMDNLVTQVFTEDLSAASDQAAAASAPESNVSLQSVKPVDAKAV